MKDVIKQSNVEANITRLHEFTFIGRIDLYSINLYLIKILIKYYLVKLICGSLSCFCRINLAFTCIGNYSGNCMEEINQYGG